MSNYVKFMRGTPKAFNALRQKDDNTLYFISEVDAVSGKLYLGEKEIICDNNHDAVASYLKNLLDVSLPDDSELRDGQVLTYDASVNAWIAKDPSGVAEVSFDENQFYLTANGELSILNFAEAETGAQLTKDSNGKLVWLKPDVTTVEGLSETVEILRSDVDTLINKVDTLNTPEEIDTKISEAIASVNHLSYKIVNSTDEIDVDSEDADRFIYLVKNGNVYDEYMVINGNLEVVGDWNVDLSSYATKEEIAAIDTTVVNIADQLNNVSVAVEEVKGSLGTISTSVEELQGQFGTVSTQVGDLTGELNKIKNRVERSENAIFNLTSALDNKVDFPTYNAKMAEIDSDLADMKAAMTWNQLEEFVE